MNYTVRHHGKKTTSLMEASGILEEHSSKLFRSTIDFLRGCSGAKGDEREDILMLGDDLVNQTIPLILCQEEDVEGNHGASMGKLDDSVLYYLSSRGIPEEKAEQIMASQDRRCLRPDPAGNGTEAGRRVSGNGGRYR